MTPEKNVPGVTPAEQRVIQYAGGKEGFKKALQGMMNINNLENIIMYIALALIIAAVAIMACITSALLSTLL